MCNHDCKQGRSCDALGMCQQHQPPCTGCTVPAPTALRLAPGAVEGYRTHWLGTVQQRRELLRWVKWGAVFGAVVAVAALLAGVNAGLLP